MSKHDASSAAQFPSPPLLTGLPEPSPTLSMEKWFSTKLVPGAKKVGDR